MATKTSTEILADLNDILQEDVANAEPWTAAVKQRAINRAIRSTFPNFKVLKENSVAITLDDAASIYSLAAITDIEDIGAGVGIAEILVEPLDGGTEWMRLRNGEQSRNAGTWYLYLPDAVVRAYDGQLLKLRYFARIPELTFTGADTIPDSKYMNTIVVGAALHLFDIGLTAKGEYDPEDLVRRINLYQPRYVDELNRNTDYPHIYVNVRQEEVAR